MNLSKITFTAFFILTLVTSCKKDDPTPTSSEVFGTLLAGKKGSSKKWKLTTTSEQAEEGDIIPSSLDVCVTDNIITFNNDIDQTYSISEGATLCIASSIDFVESGNWAFATDGKTVIIIGNHIVTASPGSLFSFYGYGLPAEVLELNENTFKIKMNYIRQQGVASVTSHFYLSFVKV